MDASRVCISRSEAAREGGFTLPELIVVMILVGILAAVAAPRLTDSGFDERRLRDETVSALRYAQKSAIAARRVTCVAFPDSTHLVVHVATAWASGDCTIGPALIGPDGTPLVITAPRNASFSAFPGGWLSFDPLGRPSATVSIAINNLSPALNIVVEAETGYVH
ncbi:MAG: type II secretion system protein [Azonexus sp.]|nr:type II secretion system protein [Azonexus sp.]